MLRPSPNVVKPTRPASSMMSSLGLRPAARMRSGDESIAASTIRGGILTTPVARSTIDATGLEDVQRLGVVGEDAGLLEDLQSRDVEVPELVVGEGIQAEASAARIVPRGHVVSKNPPPPDGSLCYTYSKPVWSASRPPWYAATRWTEHTRQSTPARSLQPQQNRRQLSAAASKDRLIEATILCMANHGPAGVSIERITDAAGVSRGLVRHHFGSKRQLLLEAFQRLADGQRAAFAAGPAGGRRSGGDASRHRRHGLPRGAGGARAGPRLVRVLAGSPRRPGPKEINERARITPPAPSPAPPPCRRWRRSRRRRSRRRRRR